MRSIAICCLFLSLLCFGSAEAAPRTFSVSSNLLGLATLNPNLDLEMRIVGNLSVGATAWWEVRDVEDRWGQVRLAYSFGAQAMTGLSVAGTFGVHRAYGSDDAGADVTATSATLGGLVGYDFRLLASEHLRAGIVAGAKATLSNHDDPSPLEPYYIEARLNLGWVF